jgi:hypothetical protein
MGPAVMKVPADPESEGIPLVAPRHRGRATGTFTAAACGTFRP